MAYTDSQTGETIPDSVIAWQQQNTQNINNGGTGLPKPPEVVAWEGQKAARLELQMRAETVTAALLDWQKANPGVHWGYAPGPLMEQLMGLQSGIKNYNEQYGSNLPAWEMKPDNPWAGKTISVVQQRDSKNTMAEGGETVQPAWVDPAVSAGLNVPGNMPSTWTATPTTETGPRYDNEGHEITQSPSGAWVRKDGSPAVLDEGAATQVERAPEDIPDSNDDPLSHVLDHSFSGDPNSLPALVGQGAGAVASLPVVGDAAAAVGEEVAEPIADAAGDVAGMVAGAFPGGGGGDGAAELSTSLDRARGNVDTWSDEYANLQPGEAPTIEDVPLVDAAQISNAHEEWRTRQLGLADELERAMRGEVPSVAEAQYSRQMADLARQQFAQAAQSRGAQRAALMSQAMANAADQQQRASFDTAALRAQETAEARAQLSSALGTARAADVDVAKTQAGFEQDADTGNANRTVDVGKTNIESTNQNRQMDIGEREGLRSSINQGTGIEMEGAGAKQEADTARYTADQLAAGTALQTAGAVVGGIVKSDRDAKKDIHYLTDHLQAEMGGDELGEFLESLRPASYRYKRPSEPGAGPGKQYGLIAQDLEETPVGASLVRDTRRGKVIDLASAVPVAFAAIARMRDEMDRMKRKGAR